MPSQKDMETSAAIPAESVKPATPTTPMPSAPPVVGATTSKSSSSTPPPVTEKFQDHCIVLILSPRGSVHPMIDLNNPAGVRIFDNPDVAVTEVMSSKVASANPFAVIPLKGLF